MLEPQKPELRIGSCLSDSVSAWASNLPVFFLATLIALIFGIPGLYIATLTGLTLITLDAMEGRTARIRTIFKPFRHPIRFIFLSGFSLMASILWILTLGITVVGILPTTMFPESVNAELAGAREAFARVLSSEVIARLPAYQDPPHNWGAIAPGLVLIGILQLAVIFVVLRCFYLPAIMAVKQLPIIDAYVESRNAVKQLPIIDAYVESRNTVRSHGYLKHLLLFLIALGIVVIPSHILEDVSPLGVALILLTPISVGIIASAYRQTVGVADTNRRLRERQFVEMRDELQTAHEMQMGLLPDQAPELDEYYLDGMSVPANNVGGDYFTYRWLDDANTRLAIVVADVSGKAMHAAVTALRFNEMLRYECRDRTEPGPILDGLTRSLDGEVDAATFVTCCIAVLHTESGRVEIANAGHCYPYQVGRKSRLAVPIEINGLPLGIPGAIRPDTPYESVTIDLQAGDGLLIYSDGVVEAQDPAGEMYEENRLADIIQKTLPTEGATTSVRTIYRSVENFIGTASRTDDLTVVALKRAIPPEAFARTADTPAISRSV